MNHAEAKNAVLRNALAGNATMLVSPSGYGKSTVAHQLIRDVRKKYPDKKVGYSITFAATRHPVDANGFTFKGVAEFDGVKYAVDETTIPWWALDRETGRPMWLFDIFVILLEEFGQGDPDTKKAFAEILLSGGTGKWYPPENLWTIRLALSNSAVRDGVTKDFDFAIARRTVINIDPDVNGWLNWADQPYMHVGQRWQTLPVTKAWAKSHPEVLYEPVPKVQGTPWCNPRTLASFDRYLQVLTHENNGELPANITSNNEVISIGGGTIGDPAMVSFLTHLQFRLELPAYAAIVADPVGTEVPTQPDLQMMLAYELAHQATPDDVQSVMTYMTRKEMAKDMQITFVSSLMKRDFQAFYRHPAFKAFIQKNATLINLVSALANVN